MTIKTHNIAAKILSFLIVTLLTGLVLPLRANAVGGASLTASSAAATKGSAVTITISLDTGGNAAFAYQADLAYSPAYFSSASISMSPGSPFTMDTGGQDPDVASGGNIHFTRFYTTAKNYSGPVATITLQSNGTAGTTSVSFKGICASTGNIANCSTIVDGSNNQLLSTLNNGTITLSEPVAVTGNGGSVPKQSPTKKVATATAATTAAPSATPPVTAGTSKKKTVTKQASHSVKLAVLDQKGKPVKGAKIVLAGISGVTDADGTVTLRDLDSGKATGEVTYRGESTPINVNVSAGEEIQAAKVNIKTSSASPVLPIAIIVGAIIVAGVTWYILRRKKVTIPRPAVNLPSPVIPQRPEPVEPPKPSRPPEALMPQKEASFSVHEKALDPGTVFSPSDRI